MHSSFRIQPLINFDNLPMQNNFVRIPKDWIGITVSSSINIKITTSQTLFKTFGPPCKWFTLSVKELGTMESRNLSQITCNVHAPFSLFPDNFFAIIFIISIERPTLVSYTFFLIIYFPIQTNLQFSFLLIGISGRVIFRCLVSAIFGENYWIYYLWRAMSASTR